jgi:spoIIIJ-associated protein
MNWVEAVGKTVDEAVAEAMKALEIESRDQVDVEILEEPKAGFLGLGGKEALVRVTAKPKPKRRRRRRSHSKGSEGDGGNADRDSERSRTSSKDGKGRKNQRPEKKQQKDRQPRDRRSDREGRTMPRNGPEQARNDNDNDNTEADRHADIEQQAEIAKAFVDGLIEAFGLEGDVATRIEDDVLYIDINGEQTEALIGPRGSVMQSILELTRTVVQRKTYGAPRMRIDISGYAERRREALNIYARKLADRVLSEGGEVMLEPMNPADRKVVHDAVAEIEGVRSFSEGEDPHRSVVIAAVTD